MVKRRSGKAALRTKLLRDYRSNAMLFLAIIALSALGTFAFSGLDATWRTLDLSIGTYYRETNLADFWIYSTSFTNDELLRLKHIEGIRQTQPRTSLVCDVVDLDEDTQLQVHATLGEP